MKIHTTFILFAIIFGIAASENLLHNPDIEAFSGKYIGDWGCSTGKMLPVSGNDKVFAGKGALQLTTVGGKGRIDNFAPRIRTVPGMRLRLAVMAKGKGTFTLGFSQFGGMPSALTWIGMVQSPHYQTSNEWKRYEFDCDIENPAILEIAPRFEAQGENTEITFDNFELSSSNNSKIAQFSVIIPQGGEHRMTSAPGNSVQYAAKDSRITAKISSGELIFRAAPDAQTGFSRVALRQTPEQRGAQIFVDVVPRKDFDHMQAAARRVRLSAHPATILVLGDSLTDFYRGTNWVDQLHFMLHGKASLVNYAIGGDYTTRILERLDGQKTWAYQRYRGLTALRPGPDMIFIWLGHNDSRLTKKSSFTCSNVPPDLFRRELASIIKRMRTLFPETKIVLFAPASGNTKAITRTWEKNNRSYDRFGVPGVVANYRDAVRDTARDNNCAFIDLFTPTQQNCDSIFMPDGVHLNDAGNRFVARLILDTLANLNQ